MAKSDKAITGSRNTGVGCMLILSGIFLVAGFATAAGVLMNGEYLFLFVPGILLFFGAAIGYSALTGKFRNTGASHAYAAPDAPPKQISRTPVALKAQGTPMGKFLGILLIAAFWNGIVSVFVWQLLPKAWGGGGEESIFLKLFLIPFLLIGLLLIGIAIQQFLALWNPRMHCKLDPGMLRLGETGQLEWHFTGPVRRIRKLTITLEGEENATYRQGTDTRTATNTFARIPVAETEDFRTIRLGQAEVTIPEFTMHTFKYQNNKILWTLKVEGDIPKWPDVSESYEITVWPLDMQEGWVEDAGA